MCDTFILISTWDKLEFGEKTYEYGLAEKGKKMLLISSYKDDIIMVSAGGDLIIAMEN